jgi:hypothetical protein
MATRLKFQKRFRTVQVIFMSSMKKSLTYDRRRLLPLSRLECPSATVPVTPLWWAPVRLAAGRVLFSPIDFYGAVGGTPRANEMG